MLDWWINQKKNAVENLKTKWEFTNDSHEIGKTLLEMEQTDIENLEDSKGA